jgi:hypothetical protein
LARTCTVCTHTDHEAIDKAIVSGESKRRISDRYGVSQTSLQRHKDNHVSPALVKMHEKREERRAGKLLDRVEELYDDAREVLETAKANGSGSLSLGAIRELRSTLDLIGRLTGELDDRPTSTVNVLVAPDWLVVREAMFEVLARHPVAQAEVASRLLELEAPQHAQETG